MRNLYSDIEKKYRKFYKKGVALIIAISLLGVFALLGMYYVRDGEIELKRTSLLLDEMRVREYAKAGVNSALIELEKAWRRDTVDELLNKCPLEFTYPYYKQVYRGVENFSVEPSDTLNVQVKVWITDESGKVNLNCSPASVLQRILNITGEEARQVVSNLPNSGANPKNARWYYLLEDLYGKNGVIQTKLDSKVSELVSTWNAGNPEKPIPYLNINKSPAQVLMAVLNINYEETQKIINARPIKTMNDLIAILGKTPASFNVKVDETVPDWQFPFTNKSNSFKITVVAELSRMVSGKKYNHISTSREVGVVFDSGNPVMVWNRSIPAEKINN